MRLIDADDFFERMKNDTDLCAEMEMCGEEALKKYLVLQPTAYDVDKVVEELELHSFELGTDTLPVHYVRLNDAIEIVKQGGVSDDTDNVCEWKKYPFDWFTGCDGYKINHKQGDYCPRCGKKIKIVGD